ncbi:tail fiber domain-containing protein [uncultured Kordia sp.]|uniref:tail fiber domain-containing protein n=1 Tax=uncultured Kordia sp. TaxID=507699 RepID=UPI0026253572|nr:tail fiber domain-containing protein [uncultured Kordia sp.]
MKKVTLMLALFFSVFSFAQNQSAGNVQPAIFNPIPQQFGGQEIFRFQPGLVTQLDAGTAFDFNTSQWFSIGKLNTGSQQVFGLRFQLKNRALTMGYQDTNDINPRIQWIGDSFASGTDLEFRVANSFTSTTSTLVTTMTNDGRTFFGTPLTTNSTRVGVDYTDIGSTRTGVTAENNATSSGSVTGFKSINNFSCYIKNGLDIRSSGGAYADTGINIRINDAFQSNGLTAFVTGSATGSTYGVRGSISSSSTGARPTGFGAAIYGSASTSTNRYAGYFNGNVFVTGTFTVSDKKFKENIKDEENVLEKLAQLDAVTYTFKPNDQLNLPEGLQHGFLAQNLEKIFPELVTTINKPIIDKENKETGTYEYKAVNYVGMISVLTSSLKEMNEKVIALENELETIKKEQSSSKNSLDKVKDDELDFSMEQNKPNPFTNQTVVNYALPNNTRAAISVFDMAGKFIRDYNLTNQKGQVTINSSEIGKGMFIYSLVSNGEIMVTKKMIVK